MGSGGGLPREERIFLGDKIQGLSWGQQKMMRCAKGIFPKGILGGTGFSLLWWEKGSETPSCGGKRGLRLPRSSCSDLGNEGVSDPFPTARGSLRPVFPPQKGKPRTSQKENPLSATHQKRRKLPFLRLLRLHFEAHPRWL